MPRVFFHSKILVYASSEQDMRKKGIAAVILEHARDNSTGVISLQVLREMSNALFRKSDYTVAEIRRIAETFHDAFPCVGDSFELQLRAIEIKDKYGIQFYDALIIATAKAAGCDTVYSEDMGDGAVYDGITVIDPFKDAANATNHPKRRKENA